ncbi:MAG TPA: Crp/Fnr family transcriptional regulator [Phenylobacterium sp.]|nr:Crp/Fnr family transcriptional regulator [Phenylobacterium sp.]
MTRPIELKLASFHPLSQDEIEVIRTGVADLQTHQSGADFRPPDDAARGRRIVVSGWMGWVAHLLDGRRQILALALPGELLEGAAVANLHMVYSPLGVTQTVDASRLISQAERPDRPYPGLAEAWTRARRASADRAVRHALRLGRLSGHERTANLLVELHERQLRSGLADERSMPLRLTQEVLSDILGLSAVHVNRILQQLRREDLIAYRAGRVVFPDPIRLRRVAGLLEPPAQGALCPTDQT